MPPIDLYRHDIKPPIGRSRIVISSPILLSVYSLLGTGDRSNSTKRQVSIMEEPLPCTGVRMLFLASGDVLCIDTDLAWRRRASGRRVGKIYVALCPAPARLASLQRLSTVEQPDAQSYPAPGSIPSQSLPAPASPLASQCSEHGPIRVKSSRPYLDEGGLKMLRNPFAFMVPAT